MVKNKRMRIDIMNRNTIISLAMLYALWQSNKQDLLDLIRPFVLYAVGNTAKINTEIDIALVCDYNVLAAITPSKELMEAYFSHLDDLERQGVIGDDEAALLRVDIFAKHELMDLTFGERDNLNGGVIDKIRQKIREESILQGRNDAQKQHEAENKLQRNKVCKQAEDEVDKEFSIKEERGVCIIKIVSVVIAITFIVASCYSFALQSESPGKWAILFVAIITTIEGATPLLSKDNFLIKHYKHYLQEKKLQALDAKKEHYLSLLEK